MVNDLYTVNFMGTAPVDRFWAKVEITSPDDDRCWEWVGSRKPYGYGQFSYHRKPMGAHRFSWVVHTGDIPDGMCVCHHCDNPSCVRPEHLFLGTHKDNADDKVRKGRQAWGCFADIYKVTGRHVAEIKLLRRVGLPAVRIARMYGIGRRHVYKILAGFRS